MNRFLIVCGLLMATVLLWGSGFAQPVIPEDVPSNVPSEVKEQIQGLYSPDTVKRGEAARALGLMGGKAAPAVPFLVGMLGDNATLTWLYNLAPITPGQAASEALVKIGQPSRESLSAAIKDKNPWVRQRAAWALAEMKDPRAGEVLIAGLKADPPELRSEAAAELGRIKYTQAVEPLIAALKDPNDVVRISVTFALGEIADRRANGPLLATLRDDPVWEVQEAASAALVNIRLPDETVGPLTEALGAKGFTGGSLYRLYAVETLGELRDPRAVQPLIAAVLRDRDPRVREAAALALGKIKDPRAVDALMAALQEDFPGCRIRAANSLGEIKEPRSIETLCTSLKRDIDPDVRRNAAIALRKIGDAGAVPALIDALKDKEWTVRKEAARSLGEIKDNRAMEPLKAAATGDENGEVRKAAQIALEEVTGPVR